MSTLGEDLLLRNAPYANNFLRARRERGHAERSIKRTSRCTALMYRERGRGRAPTGAVPPAYVRYAERFYQSGLSIDAL